jgi:hypothetical protein
MRAAAVLLTLLTLPAAALADRAPTKSEKRAIREAVRSSPRTDGFGCLRVTNIRISTKGPWSAGVARPCKPSPDAVAVVLKKRQGTWRLQDIGNGQVGCGAPKRVRKDLGIIC